MSIDNTILDLKDGCMEDHSDNDNAVNVIDALDKVEEMNKKLHIAEMECLNTSTLCDTDLDAYPLEEFVNDRDPDVKAPPRSATNVMGFSGDFNVSITNSSITNLSERNSHKKQVNGKCSTGRFTLEEKDRIIKIFSQGDEAIERYKYSSLEEASREAELTRLLFELGYTFDESDPLICNGEEDTKSNRGDPVLRQLSEKRALEEKGRNIDRALKALLKEPLPQVVHESKRKVDQEVKCDLMSITTLFEADIKELVETVRRNLEADNMELVDHDSVRLLAISILEEEGAKCTKHTNS